MCWKKLPYWVKGGVIGVIIFVILFVISMSLPSPKCKIGSQCNSPLDFLKYFFLPGFFLYNILTNNYKVIGSIDDIMILIILLIFYFIIGAIIGLIYGKIKNKGKKKK